MLVGIAPMPSSTTRLVDAISKKGAEADAVTAMYQFSVHNAARPFLSGRATVVLDAAALARTDLARRPS